MVVVKLDKETKDKLEAAGITVDGEVTRAIKNANTAGIMNIAYIYTVEREYTKVMALYHIAADKNDRKALYQVGVLYRDGLGVTKNYMTAMEWFLKAYTLGYQEGIRGIHNMLFISYRIPGLCQSINDNIIKRNKDLTADQQERVENAVLKEIKDFIRTDNEKQAVTTSKKRKVEEEEKEEEEEEENSKKIKALEDKVKLLEDKVKLWEGQANLMQQSNQNLVTLIEQERLIRNNEIMLMKQKIEILELNQ